MVGVTVKDEAYSHTLSWLYCKGDIVVVDLRTDSYVGLVSHVADGEVFVRIWMNSRLVNYAAAYLPGWLTIIGTVPKDAVW